MPRSRRLSHSLLCLGIIPYAPFLLSLVIATRGSSSEDRAAFSPHSPHTTQLRLETGKEEKWTDLGRDSHGERQRPRYSGTE